MLRPEGEQQWAASSLDRTHDIGGDQLVAWTVVQERRVNILNCDLTQLWSHPKFGMPGHHLMVKGSRLRHGSSAHAEANGTALQIDDRVVAVLASRSGGQADHILRLHLPHHLLERKRRNVVTLVDNHLAVFCD